MKKKILALMMALALVAGSATTVFASDITIDNAVDKQTYTVYKVFEADKSEDGSKVSYYLTAEEYEAYGAEVVAAGSDCGLTLQASADGSRYNVVTNDFNAEKFAANLNASKDKITFKSSQQADGTTVSFLDLDPGYYLIDSSMGAVCSALDADDNLEIYEKNEKPDIKKEITDENAIYGIGETVSFKVSVKAGGAADTSYIVKDTMTAGLTFDRIVKVSIDGVDVAASNYTVVTEDHGYTMTFPVEFTSTLAQGTVIDIEYTATTNMDAIESETINKVTLTYGDSVTQDNENTQVQVYTGSLNINKFDGDSKDALEGATFIILRKNGDKVEYLVQDPDTKSISWTEDESKATKIVTDKDGKASVSGLNDGTYFLREIEAPKGYNLMTEDADFVIGTDVQSTNFIANKDVPNYSGSGLPSTGGIGTTIFYIIGGLLVVGGAVVLITKKILSK